MSEASLPDDAGVDANGAVIGRRKWPRFQTVGEVTFHRPREKARHTGSLADISEGGLAFLTDVSLAVGETLRLSYREEGGEISAEGTVETVHSHPKADRYLVGVQFIQ